MNTKRKKNTLLIGLGAFILFVTAFTSWYYPLSPFSIHQSFTYYPGSETHNGKTYEEEISEFKATHAKDLENAKYNPTVNRTQFIIPMFEQTWLIGTDAKTIDIDKLDRMLFDVQQARNTLLELVSEEEYSTEDKVYMVDSINNFLALEDSIRLIKDGKYFSKSELQRLLGNLQEEFWSSFEYYTTVFYNLARK